MKYKLIGHPKIQLILFNLLLLALLITIVEIILKNYKPYFITANTTGYNLQYAPHTLHYGWGYFPNQTFHILNPDTGETTSEKVNRKGWRDKHRTIKNKKNAYRILILGDSETFGAIVKYHDRYAHLLEDKLREQYNVEVISLAYGGWGTDQQLEALLKEGLAYQPNLIISQFNINDLGDNSYYFYKQKLDGCTNTPTPKSI